MMDLLRRAWSGFQSHAAARMGAALAYYSFIGFFPLILVLIALISLGLHLNLGFAYDARAAVLDGIARWMPSAAQLVQENLVDSKGVGVLGVLTGLWAASAIFAELDAAFATIFECPPRRGGWKSWLTTRLKAIAIVVLLALALMGSLIMSVALGLFEGMLSSPALLWGLNLGFNMLFSAAVFTLFFRYFPTRPVGWRAAGLGGAFTALAWAAGRGLLTAWLAREDGHTAGTVIGSVLAFLALIYYAWQILLFGAELTSARERAQHRPA